MNIVFGKEYRLLKLDPGWELQKYEAGGEEIATGKYKGRIKQAGWRKMAGGNGLYPHTIKHALMLMAEDQLTYSTGSKELKQALKDLYEWERQLVDLAEVVEGKMPSE